ncbi:MAG: AAA family ATPase [Opitutales bacterium]|nr:AAA family ATPase [Opitutales bacterium]
MLNKITVRNFKRLREAEIPLGQAVVFIGPNNSGKTTALQALALWQIGLRSWLAERGGKASPEKRPGVTINRRDLISLPIPMANLLWSDLHVRETKGRKTRNIRIDILVEGVTKGEAWTCGFEFDYTSEEALVCRPLRLPGYDHVKVQEARFSEVPAILENEAPRVNYLPPMSGLAAVEPKIEPGRIDVLLGEGQTAQVLRNLCLATWQNHPEAWTSIRDRLKAFFEIDLEDPEYLGSRGEIRLAYRERGQRLDISSSGRGAQQTLLLLAYVTANPGSVLLLDEPDAHLEILRQRQIYNALVEFAVVSGSQIIAASHSEVVLNEAAGRDTVVAFVGRPHELAGGKSKQLIKSLRDIGFDQYYQAEQKGWVLYLEDSTDLPILQAFAEVLKHPAAQHLEAPFVHYVGTNIPQKARDHFFGLAEAKSDLKGVALFDRLEKHLPQDHPALRETAWRKREIENYFCTRNVLLRYAATMTTGLGPLFDEGAKTANQATMAEEIDKLDSALGSLNKPDPWSDDIKATDDFLDPLFRNFSQRLGIPLSLRKNAYSQLAKIMKPEELDAEVIEKLELIQSVAESASLSPP